MRLKTRIQNLEEHDAERQRVPFLITLSDDYSYAGGEAMTPEEWSARYGKQIEQERQAGRELFGIDFRPYHDPRYSEDANT
jgi:hypothetical protein